MSGRSSQSLVPRAIQRELDALSAFREHFPQMASFLSETNMDFRGLVVTESKHGGFVCIAKNFREDSSPGVCFAGGGSSWEVFWRMEKALAADDFKLDQYAPGVEVFKNGKKK